MEDKREYPRKEQEVDARIVVSDREVDAELRNISTGGAFLAIPFKDKNKIGHEDVGAAVMFRLTSGSSHVNYKGSIVRYTEEENGAYVAVQFKNRTLYESL
ncbi:MAG TPA: PilZ domain-containing protein [Syntrophorhabdaceae bacterium]|nr:PilZ domain-containing protein [Syntrophorhabdaceae bacterium]